MPLIEAIRQPSSKGFNGTFDSKRTSVVLKYWNIVEEEEEEKEKTIANLCGGRRFR